jgi:hypothetical protein
MDIKLLATIVLAPILLGLFFVIFWKLTADKVPIEGWKDAHDDSPPNS